MQTQALENLKKKILVGKGQNKSFQKLRITHSASLLLLWLISHVTAGHSLASLIIIFPTFLSLHFSLTSSPPSTVQLYPSIHVLSSLSASKPYSLSPLFPAFFSYSLNFKTRIWFRRENLHECPGVHSAEPCTEHLTPFISSLNQLPTTQKIPCYRDKGRLSIATLPFTPCLIYSIYPWPHLCPQSRGWGVPQVLGNPRGAIPAQTSLQLPALPTQGWGHQAEPH